MESPEKTREECRPTMQNLDSCAGNEATGEVLRAAREHLENCPECQAELRLRLRLRTSLRRAVMSESAPPDLRARILRRIRGGA